MHDAVHYVYPYHKMHVLIYYKRTLLHGEMSIEAILRLLDL